MFNERLRAGWDAGKFVSLGLDPDIKRLPPTHTADLADRVIEFNRQIIAATAGVVLAYKPQSAHYEALGLDGPRALLRTVELVRELAPAVPVIIDAKRADIGATNEAYASALFDFYGADATTVNPYLGRDAMEPFLERSDRGVIVLCRNSNPDAGRYQDLRIGGEERLYELIARDVAENWNAHGNCGLVVGATAPAELARVRQLAPTLPILVPGVGAQGGDVAESVRAGVDSCGAGVLIHASRSVLYAYEKHDELSPGEAALLETQALQAQIDAARTTS